jgi:hypothetical protein
MRVPLVYSPKEIKEWDVIEEFYPGWWRPVRPCGFSGLRYTIMRLKATWKVFTGQCDVLNWNLPNKSTICGDKDAK